jgi:hypothetical protein
MEIWGGGCGLRVSRIAMECKDLAAEQGGAPPAFGGVSWTNWGGGAHFFGSCCVRVPGFAAKARTLDNGTRSEETFEDGRKGPLRSLANLHLVKFDY